MSQQQLAAEQDLALQPNQGKEQQGMNRPIRQLRTFGKLSERLSGPDAANQVLSATIEHTHDGIMAVDGNGEIVACNRRFLEMWGIGNEDFPCGDSEKLLLSLLGQVRDPVLFFENFTEMHWQPGRESYDLVDLNDGRCFERFSKPHYLDWKTEVRIWTFHDITELKRMEAQLLHAQKMEAIGTLADGIAHDFNNIMTAVIGYADLLITELSPPTPYRGFLENINTASHRAITVVKNLLAYSRQEPVQTARIQGNELVKGIWVLLQRLVGPDIELIWEPAIGRCQILVDQAQMEQVLVNLAANARDAMPDGGTLTITVDAVELAAHEVQGYQHTRPGPMCALPFPIQASGSTRRRRAGSSILSSPPRRRGTVPGSGSPSVTASSSAMAASSGSPAKTATGPPSPFCYPRLKLPPSVNNGAPPRRDPPSINPPAPPLSPLFKLVAPEPDLS